MLEQLKVMLRFALPAMVLLASCQHKKENTNMKTTDNNSLFPKGERTPAAYFTGNAYLMPLVSRDENNNFVMGSVTFEPGARTNWHTHPKGQVLIVTDGNGFYQEKGKPAKAIKKGDVINIPEELEHWHGAGKKTSLVHIALTNFEGEKNVEWLAPVSTEEYAAVNKK
ncbi:cupin domain-containing protein [Pedobacter psychrodurus]|uniref:(R)-mandelonitrile lyase n=1 Tax=Pedobacter psychrodurus TaxID=2530456 RepID=UPI00292FCA42|nr:cupin domain-containing protein [Pedobacter psychrodurus]